MHNIRFNKTEYRLYTNGVNRLERQIDKDTTLIAILSIRPTEISVDIFAKHKDRYIHPEPMTNAIKQSSRDEYINRYRDLFMQTVPSGIQLKMIHDIIDLFISKKPYEDITDAKSN